MFNFKKQPKVEFNESSISFLNDPKKILKDIHFSNFMGMTLSLKFKIGEHEFERKIEGKTIEEIMTKGNEFYIKIEKASKTIEEELNKIT